MLHIHLELIHVTYNCISLTNQERVSCRVCAVYLNIKLCCISILLFRYVIAHPCQKPVHLTIITLNVSYKSPVTSIKLAQGETLTQFYNLDKILFYINFVLMQLKQYIIRRKIYTSMRRFSLSIHLSSSIFCSLFLWELLILIHNT